VTRLRPLLLTLTLLVAPALPASAGLERVEPAALDAFRTSPNGRVPLLVRWKKPSPLPAPLDGERRRETRRRLVAALRERAVPGARVCARLSLSQAGLRPQSLWIVNATAVSADRQALLELAHEPGVRCILAPRRLHLFAAAPVQAPAMALLAPLAAGDEPPLPWNIQRVRAPEVWAQGIRGEGLVIATLDSGGDLTHPALRERYRGLTGGDERNWFDPVLGRPGPYDDLGHGTQTLGLLVGDGGPGNRVGVAPGARWIAAKAADATGMLNVVHILQAMQWLLAPTNRAGEQPNPDMAPDIVCNSWGDYPGTDETLREAVQAWVAAGIVPVFAAGNNGMNGMSSPGSYPEAIAVGATDAGDQITALSSRGPSPIDERIKPDVVAPGQLVRSSSVGGGYFPGTGTSMSAPHVAGVAALMLQANPDLSPSAISDLLRTTADPVPPLPLPNNVAGWGRVNALAAVTAARSRGTGL
jgi:bacillopeptidase F